MRRADRLFQLVQVLRARRFATGQQIADELGVSKRTVYRDIADLQGSGVPIQGEAGVGYRIDRGFELPPLTFNAQEIESLVLGARIVATWGDSDLAEQLQSWARAQSARLHHMTFQLASDQVEIVAEAMDSVMGDAADEGSNPNRRGNALFRICREHLDVTGGEEQ